MAAEFFQLRRPQLDFGDKLAALNAQPRKTLCAPAAGRNGADVSIFVMDNQGFHAWRSPCAALLLKEFPLRAESQGWRVRRPVSDGHGHDPQRIWSPTATIISNGNVDL